MIKVISVENMRNSDAYEIANRTPSLELMWKAAMGVFEAVEWRGRIGIVCGTGNNAGDGYALSIILRKNGFDPRILLADERFSKDGSHYFHQTKNCGIPFEVISDSTSFDYDILVDCLLGTGFCGHPKENIASIIKRINSAKSYVVSVDINSGLNGDNGLGDICVKSDLTVSIGQYKYGHFLNSASDCMKKTTNAYIGIEPIEDDALLLEETDVKSLFKPRKHESNKGDYGYVAIMGGSSKYPGAPLLSSLGQNALYAGCGVSKLIVPQSIADLVYERVLETTVHPMPCIDGDMSFDEEELRKAVNGLKALGVGVGWGQSKENERILSWLISNVDIPLVIDADGLNVLAKTDLSILKNAKAKIILTPHLKEFSRLSGLSIEEIKANPVGLSKSFSNEYGVTLLLKGPTTIIASDNDVFFVNKGTPGMATAGSGDVLTGVIVGLLGQFQNNIPFTVACGAYINGAAGELAEKEFGDVSMVSSDTARCVTKVIKGLLR